MRDESTVFVSNQNASPVRTFLLTCTHCETAEKRPKREPCHISARETLA